jgi:predicted permease
LNPPALESLLPVVLLIATGWAAGRLRWVGPATARELSNLVFMLLIPALLFRTMSQVRPQSLDFTPVGAYFIGLGLVFAGTLAVCGLNRRGSVLSLAATFSNTIMIGIPLIGLAYGQQGLITLFTLYTVHTVTLLTCATLVMEWSIQREVRAARAQAGGAVGAADAGPHWGRTLFDAVRKSVIHPVPLPILAGMAFAQTGGSLPAVVDKPLALLGAAFGPMALLLVGVTLSQVRIGEHLRGAVGLVLAKNLVLPSLVAAGGVALGLSGPPLWVVVVVAALPAGANSFLFSQRYQVAEDTVTTAIGLSTLLGLLTVPVAMTWVQRL